MIHLMTLKRVRECKTLPIINRVSLHKITKHMSAWGVSIWSQTNSTPYLVSVKLISMKSILFLHCCSLCFALTEICFPLFKTWQLNSESPSWLDGKNEKNWKSIVIESKSTDLNNVCSLNTAKYKWPMFMTTSFKIHETITYWRHNKYTWLSSWWICFLLFLLTLFCSHYHIYCCIFYPPEVVITLLNSDIQLLLYL